MIEPVSINDQCGQSIKTDLKYFLGFFIIQMTLTAAAVGEMFLIYFGALPCNHSTN